MEQYNMRANFFPLQEPVNGYIGSANLLISDTIRVNGIGVFENSDGKPGHHISFPSFGEGENRKSYVIPHSPEAHAQILDVIEKAVAAEDHFGHVAGKRKVFLTVDGRAVDEEFADGRYSLQVGELFTIHGITTRQVVFTKDGKEGNFIAVNVPNLPPYEKNGEKVYPPIFKGLTAKFERDGKAEQIDYAQFIHNLVRAERKKLMQKEPLENQVDAAGKKANQGAPVKDAPAQEATR